MRLLNDNEDVLDEVILTQCAICWGTEPSIGHSQVGFTSNVDQDTPGVGGPVNNGVLTLAHPNLLDDGYFSVEITTDYSVSAIINPVPVPGVVWLFGSAVLGLAGLRRR